ncbi:putative dNA protecting protein DprA [Mycobacterium kansasii]|uniref:Putative dNA protecting protein DprA n=1 Tax=Mycobacterium kansasii TaxID=1768 RepID=A0A1V3XRR5_MYCKA|nr:putative dNA protecting protein DprA [Mycobacterium kansasii]OOK83486.1 putative dNA protecting protein DprA [Mycobacterium kansasii]
MTAVADVLAAWAYLSRVAEPPCAELAALVRRVGPLEAADRVRRGQVDGDLARHTQARRGIDRAAADLDLLMRRGGRLITPDDDEWPVLAFAAFGGSAARAKPYSGAPMVLWARGPRALTRWCHAVPLSSEPGPRLPTASTSRQIWPLDWPSMTLPSSPAERTASTAQPTAQRSIATAPPSPYWPVGSTSLIRLGIRRCCTASASMGC